MKVFISSLISNYRRQREAVASAARSVRCEVLRAEDFGARPDTPQQACLAAVRLAMAYRLRFNGDVVIDLERPVIVEEIGIGTGRVALVKFVFVAATR